LTQSNSGGQSDLRSARRTLELLRFTLPYHEVPPRIELMSA
jgi:hypothetical protein